MASSQELMTSIFDEVEKVIHGKRDKIEKIFAAWLASGHVLLEDVPGTGKTLLCRTLSKVMGQEFKRVQFTSDLLPTDITGGLILDPAQNALVLRKGPVFTTIFLGDEINRASPRTQSALLESMSERQVTIDGLPHILDDFFFVLATQNPVEQHGTFPLPEAQLDRFLIKISLGVPSKEEEIKMIKKRLTGNPIDSVGPMIGKDALRNLRKMSENVKVHDDVYEYAMSLIQKTRYHSEIKLGASPRSSLALIRYAQALALIQGQSFLTPKTIYECFGLVMEHRIQMTAEAKFNGKSISTLIQEILNSVKVPILK